MRHHRRPALTASFVAITLTLAACSSDSSTPHEEVDLPEAAPGEIDDLQVALESGVRSLDPIYAFDGTSLMVNNHLYENLLAFDDEGQLVPRLAVAWEETSPTTYVYTLREGVTFWDGSALTAEDAAYSLQRQLDPANASEYLRLLGNVAGAEATGELEVTVTLDSPDPYWQYQPVLVWPVVQKAHAEANPEDLGSPENPPIGTGPYSVESHSSATGTTIVRNDDHWDSDHAVSRVEFSVITDPEARRLAAQSGEVDVTWGVPLSQSARWDSVEGLNVVYPATPIASFISFDTEQAPFDDVHFRRAVSHAIDREGLAASVFDGRAVPTTTPVPPVTWGSSADEATVEQCYDALPAYEFDLDLAREELSRSSTPDGATVTIDVVEGRDEVDIMQSIAQNLEEIGVDLEVNPVPIAEWLANLNTGDDLGMQSVRMGAGYPDPHALTHTLYGDPDEDGVLNPSNYRTDVTAQILDSDLFSPDPEVRSQANCDLLTAGAEDAAYAGIVEMPRPFAIAEDFTYDGEVSYWVGQTGDWLRHVKRAAEQ